MNLLDYLKENQTAMAIVGGAPLAAVITYMLKQLLWIPKFVYTFVVMNVTSFVEIFENFESSKSAVDSFKRCNQYFISLDNKYIKNNIKLTTNNSNNTLIGNGRYYVTQLFKKYRVFVVFDLAKIPREDIGGTQTQYQANKSKLHQINIRVYGLNKDRDKFISDLNLYITNNEEDLNVDLNKYFPIISLQHSMHLECINFNFQLKRNLNSIYMDKEQKELLKEFLYSFINGRATYDAANIIYKTGVLLSGEPGTGKTSTIKAICSELDLPMYIVPAGYNVDLIKSNLAIMKHQLMYNSITTNLNISTNKIMSQNYDKKPLVIVFEELDKYFRNQQNMIGGGIDYMTDEDGEYITNESKLQDFLQFFDGIDSPNNVIFVATTNYIEDIEPALIRRGRFDLTLEMNKIDYKLASEMIKDMCPHKEVSEYIQEGQEINSSDLFTKLIFEQLKNK